MLHSNVTLYLVGCILCSYGKGTIVLSLHVGVDFKRDNKPQTGCLLFMTGKEVKEAMPILRNSFINVGLTHILRFYSKLNIENLHLEVIITSDLHLSKVEA